MPTAEEYAASAAASATSAAASATLLDTAYASTLDARDVAVASSITASSASSDAVDAADSAIASAGTATTAASTAVNGPATTGNSTTSLTIGTGSKSLAVEAGKAYYVGQFVVVASVADPANWMHGQITAYTTGTGAMTVNVTATNGSGTIASWIVTVSGPRGASGSGTVNSVGGTGTVAGLTLTGTVTSTGNLTLGGTLDVATANIQADAVTNAKLANVATATLKGRVTAATGDVEDLTGTQATTLLDAFTSSLKGLAPASGGGTANFLRADGTWAAAGGGATYSKAASNQTTTSATAVDITNLAFTPAANTTYEFEAVIIAKLSAGTSSFKVGIAWPTGLTTGHALISQTADLVLNDTATGRPNLIEVTNAATYLSAAFALGTDTYRLIRVTGLVDAGATPSGAFKLQFTSNGSATATIKAGSFIKYKAVA